MPGLTAQQGREGRPLAIGESDARGTIYAEAQDQASPDLKNAAVKLKQPRRAALLGLLVEVYQPAGNHHLSPGVRSKALA
jgi:hypothetical protein